MLKKKYRLCFADNQAAENVYIETIETGDIWTHVKILFLDMISQYAIDMCQIDNIEVDKENNKIIIILNDFHITIWAEEDEPFERRRTVPDELIEAARQLDIKTMNNADEINDFMYECDCILEKESDDNN